MLAFNNRRNTANRNTLSKEFDLCDLREYSISSSRNSFVQIAIFVE